ncbi:MAG: efflux RND transporter periplasmic adaptor subunit [Candidatus Gracilibacteria bacterium]
MANIGSLKTSIESDGKVTLKNELNLDFVNPGIIKNILKKEGDEVKKGETIAILDTDYLDLAIDKATIALKIAEANYNIKKRGSTLDEIYVSEKQLESSQASYDATFSQTKMDITLTEDTFKIAGENLENTKKQAEINTLNAQNNLDTLILDLKTAQNNVQSVTSQESEKYRNAQNKLLMEAGQFITLVEKNLFNIDTLLGISDVNKSLNDGYESYLGAKHTSTKLQAENSYREASNAFNIFYTDWKIFRQDTDMTQLEKNALQLREVSTLTNKSLNYTIDTLQSSITSSTFPQNTLDTYISNFGNALSSLKNETAAFTLTLQTTQEAKTSMDVKIQSTNDLIANLKQKIKIGEATVQKTTLENEVSLALATQKVDQAQLTIDNARIKKDTSLVKEKSQIEISKGLLESKKGADSLELEPFYMTIISAKKNLEESEKKKEDAYLKSPMDGKIATISGKIGETSNSLKEPFVTIINNKTFFVESQVEEVDIVKIKYGQKVYITFDAIDGLSIPGEVSYVSEKAMIDSNGIVSYKVEIIFSTEDTRIRDGMTATSEFVTKEVKNVLIIPVPAVKTINKKPSVLLKNGEYKAVITGFTDAKMVEIISGLTKGDTVIY